MSVLGKGLDRVDARQKVTGTATYAAEVAVANVTYAVIVGSTAATGEVGSIDIAAAKAQPGVLAVLTHENAPKLPDANKKEGTDKVLHVLQDAKLHYVDQPVAVVVADTLERAQHAASLVAVTYTGVTAPVIDLAAGETYAPKKTVRGDPDSKRGDVAAGLAAAAHKVDVTYTTPNETHNPMEMHATIAVWGGDDSLTLYDSTQGIFGVRARLATIFGIQKDNVRVINHFVGGGFGSKGSAWSHVPLAALAAKVVGRPVKLVVTRQQMFSLVGHRPVTSQHVVLGCDKAGKLTAMMHEVLAETSRFDEFVEPAALGTRMLYACPNVSTLHRLSRVDVPTPTFTRAPGEASGSFALESAMDELAYAAGLDPIALRVMNHATKDEHEQKPFSSKTLLECYKRGAEAFGWAKRAKTPRMSRDGRWLVGLGMATATYPARQLPSSAVAKLRPDGTLLVQAGTQDIGTGTYTVMTQVASDASTVAFEKIKFELGDTALPETPLSAGSFTVSSTGSAVKMTCKKLVEKLVELAVADGPLKGVDPKTIVAQDGALVAGGKRDGFGDIVKRSGAPELVVEHKTMPSKERDNYSMHSFGAIFADVRVDEELGRIRIVRMTGAYAAGQILNAKTARSQFMGGIVWGIGMALTEHVARDPRTARAVTRDLADYHVPVNADVPPIDVISVAERDDFVNELGAKGIGEIGTVGAAAAIANAVYHATGKRIRDLPLTLDKLLPEVRA